MQSTTPLSLGKKILIGVAGLVLVVAISIGTAFALSYVFGSKTETTSDDTEPQTQTEISPIRNQLGTLYAQSSPERSGVAIEEPFVTESAIDGYKTAKAIVADGEPNQRLAALFYQKPDESWHFFAAAIDPDMILCADFNSDDLTNAFVGFTCVDEMGVSSFVQTPEPTFEVIPGSSGN